ncbi:uncharacterized protein BO96DRAFT_195660 [Aspergillus niger CBS 101883]|uniref:Uncharacterized protein n=1 Tax=Aspergillus niger ATCC 13496 TaxID=1353008 RepID=A0A370BWW5_ASPNG|nr:uncharacterized protein BO96DRAFT_195660 [Aspergillus niger CBS 101883]PYH51197.1 hypothetical protein BO96DRAFT_195660 [Aspergillus niger CBS 101883]RDH19984.1 hypothetical protein M747DRAFT_44925 [Aspergillus niger ATCC 13496]
MIPAVEAPFLVSCILVTFVCPMYSLCFIVMSPSALFLSITYISGSRALFLLSVCLGDTVIFSISFQLSLRGDEEYQGLAFG